MTLTAAQTAQACPSCATDPAAAPSRYCPSRRCLCGHPSCPAFAYFRALERPFGYVELLHKPKPAKPSRWAEREESTWIDSM